MTTLDFFPEQAARFATRPEQRIRELRRQGVADAVDFMTTGNGHIALDIMLETFTAQARAAGIRLEAVQP